MKHDVLARPRSLMVGLLVTMALVFSPLSMADRWDRSDRWDRWDRWDEDDSNCKGRCQHEQSQNIVVHLKRHIEDLQGAITAVRLATLMQSNEEVDVTLFLTLGGVRLADKRMPQDLVFGRQDSDLNAPRLLNLKDFVAGFQGAGGRIAVCPACAGEIDLTPDDLIHGAEIVGPEAIAEIFLTADKVLDF